MKNATPALIAFLAAAKQFVMWETYTFTLADGTVIEYSTRDEDAPPLPVAPPPAPEVTMHDTFTGNGTLATHVGEINAVWSLFEFSFPPPPGLSDAIVSDGLTFDSEDRLHQYYKVSGCIPAGTSDFRITFSMYMAEVVSFDDVYSKAFIGWTDELDNIEFKIGMTGRSNGTMADQMSGSWNQDGDSCYTVFDGFPVNTDFTVRLDVTDGRKLLKMYVNDTLSIYQPFSNPMLDAPITFVEIQAKAGEVLIHEVKIETL